MVHEHLLDFSYAPVVHAGDLPEGLDAMPPFNDVEITETTVSYRRAMPDLPLAGWQADGTGLDPASTYQHSESGTFVSPAVHRQYWIIEAPDGRVYTTTRTHGITPETENSTHVFMQSSRNYALDDDRVSERLRAFLAGVSQRDTEVLEMASEHSGYDGWRSGVEFQADAAAIRARRIVGVMLAKESGRAPIRPGLAPNSRSGALSPSGSPLRGS
jgi:vanillate O-demethylase monooxygenase subunit